jgi:hypothetical protein
MFYICNNNIFIIHENIAYFNRSTKKAPLVIQRFGDIKMLVDQNILN